MKIPGKTFSDIELNNEFERSSVLVTFLYLLCEKKSSDGISWTRKIVANVKL